MRGRFEFGGNIVWSPSQDYIENANITDFMRKHEIKTLDELHKRAKGDVAWFTESVLDYLDIQFYEPYAKVVDLSEGIAWPKWCVGGKMNIVHNCVDKYMGTPKEDQVAFIWEKEEGEYGSVTYKGLHSMVNRTANALRSLGLGKGDAIGIFMPMSPEIVAALLAIAKIGGISLPLFSGFGVWAVVTRLADADAKAIFTVDGFFRRGRTVNMKDTVDEAAKQIPSLEHMVVLNRANLDVQLQKGRDHWWHEIVESQSDEAEAEITDAEDPMMVIYTSGTTGTPKGALHTHCGFPIKSAQDMAFGTDVRPGHIIHWMTDMGWMMGPWLVFGALLLGSTFVIYDGAPNYPEVDRVWSMVEQHRITTLGLSPTFIRAIAPLGAEYARKHDLSSLRYFASTGEPWNHEPWMWLFKEVGGSRLPIINYSGGTEVSGGIVMGSPILPLKPCSFSGLCPGIAGDVFDENGRPVRNQVGELVITQPWIGMTRGFWKNPERYEDTYWSRWKDVWVHGDFAAIDSDGLWYILGRSDDIIKVAGKRFGPAEAESVLVNHAAVIEAAAIGIPHDVKGNELVVFCVLGPGVKSTTELESELSDLVIRELGKPLAPREVLFVTDLPKTRNAKVMRRMVRAAYLGEGLGDTSSLVNPEALDEVREARRN
jgi:acetyl-CoA synthetase